jgi:hypothetical protein
MTILVIVFAELLRAYGARSMRYSVLACSNSSTALGFFSNKWMQYSVGVAVVLTLVMTQAPVLRTVFGTTLLNTEEYTFCAVILFVPFVVDELTKLAYRKTGFGLRATFVQ